MYQRVGKAAYKADLSNTLLLMEYLDNPETAFKSIHVAGTNGKGSVSHMMASVLQEAGYRVGLYTSPHLKDFRERIKINGQMIPKRQVSSFVGKHKAFFEENQLSFFEMTVGLAFDYFRKEEVDIAVIEVGLGGRLDSTNVITPEVSVITSIGLDHTQFLGDTLESIAREKAGIIKKQVPVVISESATRVADGVFREICHARMAPMILALKTTLPDPETDLMGNYQVENARTAQVALRQLRKGDWEVPEEVIEKGLKKVVENTDLLGRWQVLQTEPKVICDTAHNKQGLTIVLEQLTSESYNNLHIVLGSVDDKNHNDVLSLFPKAATYYFCKPDIPRGLEVKILSERAKAHGLKGSRYGSVQKAYSAALKAADSDDLVFVGGSTFVVAEVI